jgi:predicted aconitase with swiveling domain
MSAATEILVPGTAGEGEALVLTAPISFWGGVDPKTGRIADVRHPHQGYVLARKLLVLPATIGSSTPSAVLRELGHTGRAPAALVLHEPDAILLLGLIVAREMSWQTPIAVRLERDQFDSFRGGQVAVGADGSILRSLGILDGPPCAFSFAGGQGTTRCTSQRSSTSPGTASISTAGSGTAAKTMQCWRRRVGLHPPMRTRPIISPSPGWSRSMGR